MKILLYNLVFPFAFLVYLPFFLQKMWHRGGFTSDFWERFGFFSQEQRRRLDRLSKPVWLHAVSVGEVVAAIGFIERWRERKPEQEFVLSTTTTTGYATARQRLPERVVLIYSPLDFFFPVIRGLRLVKPSMLVIFEVEIWPNLISLASLFKIPIALVNGRLSDRSALGYARHRWFFRPLLKRFNCICVQSEDDAERVKRVTGLNAPVYVCNTMKFDQVAKPDIADLSGLLNHVFSDVSVSERIILTAGSTHPGEEDLLLRVFRDLKIRFPGLRLVLVPRHSERSAEVEGYLRNHQLTYRRRSQLPVVAVENGGDIGAEVLLVDTTGELMSFYAVSDIVYVGKSLGGNRGGHNIIEPALFGKPIIHGADMDNFRLVASLFKREDGCREVANEDQLRGTLIDLLERPDHRVKLGRRALRLVEKYRGAMDKTLKHLEQIQV